VEREKREEKKDLKSGKFEVERASPTNSKAET